MSLQRQKRLDKAQLEVLFRTPFFAAGVAKLPVVWDDSIDTACTDGKEIRWSGPWFDSLPDSVLPTVLCHEVAHAMLGHLWRAPAGADFQTWNIACDHAVNLMLKEFSATVTGKGLADPFPFPDPQNAYCADPQFAGMAEEPIYGRLANRPKSPSGGSQGSPGGSGSAQGSPGAQSKPGKQGGGSKGASQPANPSQKQQNVPAPQPQSQSNPKPLAPAPHSMPEFGGMKQPSAADPSSNKRLRNDWEGTLIQACQIAKGRGELPGAMQRLVDSIIKPLVPWPELLRAFLREQAADDWDWLHPDPHFDETGFILPSLRSEAMGSVVFATDTSGSIDAELLAKFQSEKQACLDELRPQSLLDIYCDAKVHKAAEYRPGENIAKDAPGGGGTAFEPVFEHVDKLQHRPKCLVYLTDLYGSFPAEDPGYPVLWVTWTKDGKAPFGEVVYAPLA